MSIRAPRFALFLLLIGGFSFSQNAPQVAPLPYDPLELATGPTVVPDTPERREVLLNLLERARQNSALHTPGMAATSRRPCSAWRQPSGKETTWPAS